MTTFSSSNSFGRGEIDESLQDLRGQDFYASAAAYIENWYPDRVGGLFKRPAFSFGARFQYNTGSPSALDSIAPNLSQTVSLTGRSITFGGTPYVYESRDLFMRVVELSGVSVAIFVETLTRNDTDSAPHGNCVIVTAQKLLPGSTQVDPDPVAGSSFLLSFDNAATNIFTKGFPYNNYSGHPPLTPPLSKLVRISVAGPAAFIATGRMPLLRVYMQAGFPFLQPVQFYEELVGSVTADSASTSWTGTDTLFQDQLAVGDIILFKGETYEIATIADQTNFTTTSATTSASVTAGAAVQRSDPFGTDQFPAQVTFFQNRLVLASTADKPTGIWASESSNPYVILAGNVEDSSPINFEVLVPEATQFRWMTSTDRIYLGGTLGEFAIGQPGEALTPTNFPLIRIGTSGSEALPAAITDTSFLHASRYGEHIFAVQFDFNRQAFASSDITFLSSQLFDQRVSSFSYRAASPTDPTPRVYVVAGGEVRTAAYATSLNLLAWTRVSTSNSNAQALLVTSSSLATYFVVRDEVADCYQVWVDTGEPASWVIGDFISITQVDSQTKIQVNQPYRGAVLAITTATTSPTILGYVTADSSGEADLTSLSVAAGDYVYYMFDYDATLRLLPVAASDARGPMLNRKRRLVRALVDVLSSVQIYVNSRPLLPEVNPNGDTFTGVYSIRMLGWAYTDQLEITAPSIYRARIRSVTREVST